MTFIRQIGKDTVNDEGLGYYHNLIEELKKNGIQPVVSLYAMDLPTGLEKNFGWLNPKTANHFMSYAAVCFKEFGDKVSKCAPRIR